MNFLLLLVIVLVVVSVNAFGGGGMAGGWSAADVRDNSVLEAAKFAVAQKFPNDKVEFDVVRAMKQVVAGMNYDLTVNVRNLGNNQCQVHHFQVYDRWGTRALQLAELVSNHCGSFRE